MSTQNAGWLEISTEGFASFNQSRPPGHLVKELVQNSFDAIGAAQGSVGLSYSCMNGEFRVACRDTGDGMADLSAIRVVYLTFKKDTHLKRGRFGRGFKEVLSVAREARVLSGQNELRFIIEEGKNITRSAVLDAPVSGTVVEMTLPWGEDAAEEFDTYFGGFLIPVNIAFTLNGHPVPFRAARNRVDATLTTEVYHQESHSWRKPRRKTTIDLVPVREGEEPTLFEMGIPVAPAEWNVPFHANIQQRVPMNPNRDALASGYARSVHAACLHVLLDQMTAEQVTSDWVGTAGLLCDETVQKQIVERAFGKNAVRSVPTAGKRDFNNDAERAGASVVKTSQMSAGFREMAKEHLPSARDHVNEVQAKLTEQVARTSFDPNKAEGERLEWIERRGGAKAVQRSLDFAVWFCQRLIDHGGEPQPTVTGAVAVGYRPQVFITEISKFVAHWSEDNCLTLALDVDCFWVNPLGAEALGTLVHEAAHARNMHHGKSFHDEVERLAGVASEIMFTEGDTIRSRWPELVATRKSKANGSSGSHSSWLTRLFRR